MIDSRRLLRDLALDAMAWCKLLDVFQIATGQTCTVLVYHSVASGEHNPYIDPDTFTAHMDMLRAEFHVLSADEYLAHVNGGKRIPRRSVLITIDDGLENNYTIVQPIMEQRQLPWVLFTPTQALEEDRLLWFAMLRGICLFSRESSVSLLGGTWVLNGKDHRPKVFNDMAQRVSNVSFADSRAAILELTEARAAEVPEFYVNNFCRLMTAEQLCHLAKSPLVEVGCHTKSHPFLPRVSNRELTSEVDEATNCLSDLLNRKIRMFAYPSGVYGFRELQRVATLGYDCAFAVNPLLGVFPKYEIPRIGIYNRSVSVARAKSLGLSSLLKFFGGQNG
jgi:peptidoglycan/xylan/chitin deacetylase (PgdA/CDA1 family)